MSFSNIALQQRKRESKALRIFLACSLAGSLLFHLTLLASGIVKYLNRVPEIEEEPVEITLLDTPIEEIEPKEEEKPKPEPEKIEPKQEKPEPEPEPKPEPEPNITQDTTTQSRISGGSQAPRLFEPIPTQPRVAPPPPVVEQPPLPKLDIPPIKPVSPPVVQQQPVIPEPEPDPILESKLSEEFKIPKTAPTQPPIPQPKPEPINPPIQQPSPIPQSEPIKPREFSIPTAPPVEQPKPIAQPDTSGLIGSLKESQENRQISSNNTPPSLPDTSSTTPTRRRRIIGGSNIATAPSTDSGIGDGTGDSVGDGDGRGAFRECNAEYPNWAEKQRIEGKITVAVDADTQGNVTNVRLINGSGNDRLNNYHLEQVRRTCKFEPSSNGIQGRKITQTYRLE
ncbi:MAG: TonB family protein [Cyanobacteria bacterium J06628_3]